MKLIKKSLGMFSKFTVLDAMFFEIGLFTLAMLIAKLLPIVLILSIWVYIIVLVVGLSIVIPAFFKNRVNGIKMMDNYRSLKLWKRGVYIVSVITAGLLILNLIPIMLSWDIVWYVGVSFFCIGYIVAVMFRK